MTTPQLTETQVRNLATPEVFQRGWDYYYSSAVLRLVQRGDALLAEVQGSGYEPYRVHITFRDGDIATTSCTCPYEWSNVCKHVVAALLTYLYQPEEVEQRPPLTGLLAGLNADQLQEILLRLVEQQPELADLLESYVIAATSQPPTASSGIPTDSVPLPPLNLEIIRHQVSAALHAADRMRYAEDSWRGSSINRLAPILEQVDRYLQVDSGGGVLQVLEEITEEYVKAWLADEGYFDEAGDFFYTLADYWLTALLSADLTRAERQKWADRLEHWQSELSDYGFDEVFDTVYTAAEQGWDDPRLKRALRGEMGKGEYWEDEPPDGDLVAARLEILERQGRNEEYLNLALAADQVTHYAVMLAKLGRIEEATEVGLRSLAAPTEALAVAQALHTGGAVDAALRVAEQGLALEGDATSPGLLHTSGVHLGEYASSLGRGKVALARWLRDQASAQGQTERALHAALVAARESTTLADYQAAQALADERWPGLRDEVLNHIRQDTSYWNLDGKVDILLYEEMFDDAIAVVESSTGAYSLAEKVADALIERRPAWVIDISQRHAERIADQAKADRYSYAVHWLYRARDAARVAGREPEFRTYVEQLIAKHKRKYKLVPMLQALLRR
jgi:uncharacterized Zn finger protein